MFLTFTTRRFHKRPTSNRRDVQRHFGQSPEPSERVALQQIHRSALPIPQEQGYLGNVSLSLSRVFFLLV